MANYVDCIQLRSETLCNDPCTKCPSSKCAVDAVISHSPLFAFYNLDVSCLGSALFSNTCLGLAVFICAMLASRQG